MLTRSGKLIIIHMKEYIKRPLLWKRFIKAFLLLKIKMPMWDVFLIFILFLSLLKNRMKEDKIYLIFLTLSLINIQ